MPGNVRTSPSSRPTAVRRAYDVCVLGADLPGALAGALLARRGHRVLHVDLDGRGSGYDEEGWHLPWGPSLLPSPRGMPAADAALAELGAASDAGRLLEPARPALQILLPRHRLDLPAARGERGQELRREWPGDASRIEAALDAVRAASEAEQPFLASFPPLPPRGLGERWRLHRARRLAPRGAGRGPMPLADLGDHPLAAALRGAGPFLSFLDGEPAPFGLARTLGAALQGTVRGAGGEAALAALLRRRIADSRGELLGGPGEPAPVAGLEIAGGKVEALRLKGGDAVYTARSFVLGADAAAVAPLLGKPDAVPPWLAGARPAGWLETRNWLVRSDGLPAPLGDVALAIGSDGTPVLLQSLPALRSGPRGHEPGAGERVLSAATPRRADEPEGAAAGRLRGVVAEYLPFLDRVAIHGSDPGARPHGRSLHPLFPALPDRALGVGGIPSGTPIGNLFLAGREVLPGLGLEGRFHAAWQAAAAVERHLGTRNRPK
ncbi:MAG TPA: phytoene dehydrogenase [Anaeromyxobacteraceae bacterium]|nr:phytoene dehydrogenase [Anaeromyxobacteraceae bacterium]